MHRMCGLAVLVVVLGFFQSSCAMLHGTPYSFQSVELQGNLSQDTVNRYEREYQALKASGQGPGMVTLEYANWWPSGLLLYWRRASVMRTETPQGPLYEVRSAHGLGPLCLVYVGDTHATYDGSGRRLSGMEIHSVLLGHLAMAHASDSLLPDGRRQEMASMHLVHHLFNVHTMDGHSEVSLLTGPNPLAIESHGAHAHAHHAATDAHAGHTPAPSAR